MFLKKRIVYYLPPYKCKVWHYQKVNSDDVRQVIANFYWDRAFANLNVNEMVHVFNKTIKIPFLTPFFMKLFFIMTKILLGSLEKACKFYVSNKYDNQSFSKFQLLQDQLSIEIEKSKQIYYS